MLANFFTLLTFLLINISIIFLRIRKPSLRRYYKIPFAIRNVPLPPVIANAFILVMLAQFSPQILAYGFAIVLASIVFYYIVDKWKLIG